MNDDDLSLLTENEKIQLITLRLKALGYDVQTLWDCMIAVLGEHEPGDLTERQYAALAFERYHAVMHGKVQLARQLTAASRKGKHEQ